jgi:hypothetical protein
MKLAADYEEMGISNGMNWSFLFAAHAQETQPIRNRLTDSFKFKRKSLVYNGWTDRC